MTQTPRFKSIYESDPDFRRDPKGDYCCVNCHRPINKEKGNYRLIHVVNGGDMYLHPEDEALYVSDAGDCGLSPVGVDCATKIGLEWTVDPAKSLEWKTALCAADGK